MKKNYVKKRVVILILMHFIFSLTIHAEINNLLDSIIPKKNIDYIDPTIGNVGQLLEPTRPTSYLPNQVVRVYPIRKDYLDDQISSFPLTAVSHRLGEVFAIKPVLGTVSSTSWDIPMPYDHNLEVT